VSKAPRDLAAEERDTPRYQAVQSGPGGWGVWDSLLNRWAPWEIFGNYGRDEIRGITRAGAEQMARGLSRSAQQSAQRMRRA
jgi:hypothetical protein